MCIIASITSITSLCIKLHSSMDLYTFSTLGTQLMHCFRYCSLYFFQPDQDFELALQEIQPKFGANNEELSAMYRYVAYSTIT
jgi:hypothetical protein